MFARQADCLQIEVLLGFGNLSLGVASHSPLVYYRDNDRRAGDLPLAKINAPFTGW